MLGRQASGLPHCASFLCLQLELRDLQSGSRQNERLRSYDQVEVIRLEQQSYTYLYEEGGASAGAGGCRGPLPSGLLTNRRVAASVPLQQALCCMLGIHSFTVLFSSQTSLCQAVLTRLHEHIARPAVLCPSAAALASHASRRMQACRSCTVHLLMLPAVSHRMYFRSE